MNVNTTKLVRRCCLTALCLGLAACGSSSNDNDDDNDTTSTQEFRIDVTNLTAAQPFSPVAVIAHDGSYSLFTVGSPASDALELLAEGGDNGDLLSDASTSASVITTASDTAPTGPGASTSLTITVEEDQTTGLELIATTMLVNSNDAFTALNNLNIANMAVGETRQVNTISYDSGTEANSEAAGSIPGPVDGGEGFNSARDDIADIVTMHSGVLTSDDGLSTSVLTDIHRWDNPIARISVTRTQ